MPLAMTFIVLGRPQPAGSKRAFVVKRKTGAAGVAVADDNPALKSWQQEIRSAASKVSPGALLDGPLSLDVRFYFARPRSHFGTGRNASMLKPSAPPYPIVRPDTTKLIRAIEDALTGVVWRDDALVVSQVAAKLYDEPERAVVGIYRL